MILVEANFTSTVLMALLRVTMSAATASNWVFRPSEVTGMPDPYVGVASIGRLIPDPDFDKGHETLMLSCFVVCKETMAFVF